MCKYVGVSMNISLPSIMAKVVWNLSRNEVGRVPDTWHTVGIQSLSFIC